MKVQLITGTLTSANAAATQLTSTAYKALSVTFTCGADDGWMVGDSNVSYSTPQGLLVSAAGGTATTVVSATLSAGGAQEIGTRFVEGAPYIDLSEVYAQSAAAGDRLSWIAFVITR